MTFRSIAFLSACLLSATGAQASVTLYSSAASFDAAITVAASENFDSRPTGPQGISQSWGGIDILSLTGGHPQHDIYVVWANSGAYSTPTDFTTQSLTADGDENFRFSLTNGHTFNAIGFDVATNPYGPITVSLYNASSALITSVQIPLGANTMGFFGLTSTDAISYVTTTVDRGWLVDTGLDNLRLGSVAAVPEPASWALMIGGFAFAGATMRRRAARVAFI